MANASIILGISHISIGILIIGICIPLLKGKVKMNYWWGVRFKESFESTENWYRINKYGARRLILWSAILIAIGIVAMFLPANKVGIILLAFAPIIYIIPAVESWLFAKKQ